MKFSCYIFKNRIKCQSAVDPVAAINAKGDKKHEASRFRQGVYVVCRVGAATLPGRGSAQDKVVWKASDVHPLGYPTVEAIQRMGKKLEQGTNGRISIQMYPSMQLGGEKEMIDRRRSERCKSRAYQLARWARWLTS